jgi:hypothetical protein
MTSYHPEDVKHGYCGKCLMTTNGTVCLNKCVHKQLDTWEHDPIVTDSPVTKSGPTRPPVVIFWDWFMRVCLGLAALISLVYVLYVVVVT